MGRFLRPITPLYLTAIICLLLSPGCGKKKPELIPVTGKVFLGSNVITSGQVTFVPMEERAGADLSAGSIESNGEYKIFTDGKHGAPAGMYKVTVTPSMKAPADGKAPTFPFNAKFGDPKKTTLQVEVKAGAPEGAYNLILSK